MENQVELDINAKEKSISGKGMKANKSVSARDKGMDALTNSRCRRQIFVVTIVNDECGETNFQYALVGVHDICVCTEN